MRMVTIINKTKYKDFAEYYPLIDHYYQKTLDLLQLNDDYSLTYIITGPIAIRRINREYRKIDKETDVISFAMQDYDDGFSIEGEEIELGDIFVNRKRILSQASEYGHSVKREFVFLFVHGLLHLLGYDHMKREDEEIMFGLQKRIVDDLF